MNPPLFPVLWAAIAVVVLGTWALRKSMPLFVALGAMLLKAGLAVGFAFTGDVIRWSLRDDMSYYHQGRELLVLAPDPFTFFLHRDLVLYLATLSQGFHVLYGWYNYLTMWLLGPYYVAPVLGNVLLTALAARGLFALAEEVGAPRREATLLAVFMLVHWDVLAWSSFVNVKDNLVLAMTVYLLLGFVRVGIAPTRGRIAGLVLLSILFLTLRFYVPLIALACFSATNAGARGAVIRHRWALSSAALTLVFGILWLLGPQLVGFFLSFLHVSPPALASGLVRIVLTPQPWSIQPNYEYLIVPSVLNLALLLPALAGMVALERRYPRARFLVLYYVVTIVLFAAFPRQQGPRYRYQVVFMLGWGLVHLALSPMPRRLPLAAGASTPA